MDFADLNVLVASFFGLPVLNEVARKVVNPETGLTEVIHLSYYWVANISHWRNGRCVVGILKTEEWTKGILLVPPVFEPKDRQWAGKHAPKPIELKDQHDPAADAITRVNLLPLPNMYRPWGNGVYWLSLMVGTWASHAELIINTDGADARFVDLWSSVVKTVFKLVELYDDDEIRAFFAE